MRKVIIAQARLRSSRLWGKVLYPILDRPMVAHVIERLTNVTLADLVVVATSDNPADNVIADWAEAVDYGEAVPVRVFRGSEDDVLGRFLAAARYFNADQVIRVCCDAPLLDPQVIDRAIGRYLDQGGGIEYLGNMLHRTFPRGQSVEVMDVQVLEKLDRVSHEPHQREHVTPYLLEHPDQFRIEDYLNDRDLSQMNWTVDTIDDLEFVREVYRRLYRPGKIFGMMEVVELLDNDPDLAGKGALR